MVIRAICSTAHATGEDAKRGNEICCMDTDGCSVKLMLTGQAAGLVSPTGACGTRYLNVEKTLQTQIRFFHGLV